MATVIASGGINRDYRIPAPWAQAQIWEKVYSPSPPPALWEDGPNPVAGKEDELEWQKSPQNSSPKEENLSQGLAPLSWGPGYVASLALPPLAGLGSVASFPGPRSTERTHSSTRGGVGGRGDPGGRRTAAHLLHEIQHHLKTSLLSGLAVSGGLRLKLLTYLAHDTMLFLIFFKLLWRKRLPVSLQPFWILRKRRTGGEELMDSGYEGQ